MPSEDKSDGSGSSDGHSGSLGIVEKVAPVAAGNIRARVGLYVKDGERLRADFHSLYRALPDQRLVLVVCFKYCVLYGTMEAAFINLAPLLY